MEKYAFESNLELLIKQYLGNKKENASIDNFFPYFGEKSNEKMEYIKFEKSFVVYIESYEKYEGAYRAGYIYAFDYDGNKLWNIDEFQIIKRGGYWTGIRKSEENSKILIAYNFIGITVHIDMNNYKVIKKIFTK